MESAILTENPDKTGVFLFDFPLIQHILVEQ